MFKYWKYFHFETREFLKYYRRTDKKSKENDCQSYDSNKKLNTHDSDFDPYEHYDDFDVIISYKMFESEQFKEHLDKLIKYNKKLKGTKLEKNHAY